MIPDEEKLLGKDGKANNGRERVVIVVLEQSARGVLHALQFAVSYCIMLLFMYSNGEPTHLCMKNDADRYRVYHHFDSVWSFGWICALH